MEKTISTTWDSRNELVVTTLSGRINDDDVNRWNASLESTLKNLPDGSRFKILVNLHGFEAENIETHKRYRTIMPLLLSQYGYRIGYLDMFPDADVELRTTRGIRCIAMANVHHDADKMNDYQRRFSNEHEKYFTEIDKACTWLAGFSRKQAGI